MLSQLFKTATRASRLVLSRSTTLSVVSMAPRRFYYPGNQLMERETGEYYADPIAIAERVVRLIGLHDTVRDPAAITLNSSFDDLGLNVLDLQEIFLQAEREFDIEISEEDCESFNTVSDLVENLARNFYTK